MAMSWKDTVEAEWHARCGKASSKSHLLFPLAANPFGADEVVAMTDVLLSGHLTLGEQTANAEREFAAKVGAPYACMVNSGSSANLLAVAALANKLRSKHCKPGDEVLIPAVCWSTSLHPLLQCGLKPVWVDVDPVTLNVTVAELEKKLNPNVKAILAVHVLGNSTCMRELLAFASKHDLMLVEDTCESLGSYYDDDAGHKRMLGTAGDFGTYSFYFSHHITSGEGGMVVCKTEDDYNLLRCLRAHGWTRHLTNAAEVDAKHPDVDSRFLFINLGYNLRPLEVQAAMLRVQLAKLDGFNACRRDNVQRITKSLKGDARLSDRLALMEASPGTDAAWFGLAFVLKPSFKVVLSDYLAYLTSQGVENRPIISGNFIRQPVVRDYCPDENPVDYEGAELLHQRGFFVGVHQLHVKDETIAQLVEIMMRYPLEAGSPPIAGAASSKNLQPADESVDAAGARDQK
jgi:CDP-4-dehydro-6-deoxyglucose reductase, E1